MRIPDWLYHRLLHVAITVVDSRAPDQVIGGSTNPYLYRWYLTSWSNYPRGSKPRNLLERIKRRLPNVYVHRFMRSDDDRALHDHPWWNTSILLLGRYREHTIVAGGINHVMTRVAGEFKLRPPRSAHRIEIDRPCLTIFITGPKVREWGFHCPHGWRHWEAFTAPGKPGEIGRGCE